MSTSWTRVFRVSDGFGLIRHFIRAKARCCTARLTTSGEFDLQLDGEADPEEESKPERVIPRLKAMLGHQTNINLEWVSIYTSQCRRLKRFRHNWIIFAGDSARQVSPFGARGGNRGVQDADNLCWKLASVILGTASEQLLDSYDEERTLAAEEEILSSTRSSDFIRPKGYAGQMFRDAVLQLARRHEFERLYVNSGRLSAPTTLSGCALQTPDGDKFERGLPPGSPCLGAPVKLATGESSWLRNHLGGEFCLLVFAKSGNAVPQDLVRTIQEAKAMGIGVRGLLIADCVHMDGLTSLMDADALIRSGYDGREGTVYLIRPDQQVAARWRNLNSESVLAAISRAAEIRGTFPVQVRN